MKENWAFCCLCKFQMETGERYSIKTVNKRVPNKKNEYTLFGFRRFHRFFCEELSRNKIFPQIYNVSIPNVQCILILVIYGCLSRFTLDHYIISILVLL